MIKKQGFFLGCCHLAWKTELLVSEMSLGYHFCFGLILIDLLDLFDIMGLMDLLNLTNIFLDIILDDFLDALDFDKLF